MVDQHSQPQANKLAHPCFPQPVDTSVRVWRYLDLAKFIWLLENKKLYLPRIDLLNDPYEGSSTRLYALLRDQEHSGQISALMRNITQHHRKSMYVNCWHLGNSESEAMWRLYCPNESGVAIQLTYRKLVVSIENDPFCYIGCVSYVDYDTQVFRVEGNSFSPVMHKRSSFAHEQEVRLVKTHPDYWGVNSPGGPSGVTVDWSPEAMVDAIYVNPYAPEFYRDVVQSIVRRIAPALENQVIWSPMRAAPVY